MNGSGKMAFLAAAAVFLSLVPAATASTGPAGTAQNYPIDYTRQTDIIYGRRFGLALTLDVFSPPKPAGVGVVWVVSSGGRSTPEQTRELSFERRIAPLLAHGYTVFAVIHGSSPAFQVQDHVQDVKRAVRFVRHHAAIFGIDARRLAIAGSSSGGMVALTVAMLGDEGDAAATDVVERVSSRVQAVGCFFPPTDLVSYGDEGQTVLDVLETRSSADPAFQFYETDRKTGVRSLITDRDRVTRILRDVSPVTHASADDPPAILIHGDRDKLVPIEQSRRLVERLSKVNVQARLVVREGMGHAWPGWEGDAGVLAEWFDLHLRQPR
jgi:acetyl esterase/lipase